MLIIVKCCEDYHTAMVKGVIMNHFLLLQIWFRDTCTIKLFQNDSVKKIITVWMSRNNSESKTVQ